ncbi:hypothetical protein QBC44DRAFT_73685 [Cladorrhinum sp. PSN332]|nr:hypothetical protein QBC44DRAFT_73685 [Cladorrhinum sp. PSN332]
MRTRTCPCPSNAPDYPSHSSHDQFATICLQVIKKKFKRRRKKSRRRVYGNSKTTTPLLYKIHKLCWKTPPIRPRCPLHHRFASCVRFLECMPRCSRREKQKALPLSHNHEKQTKKRKKIKNCQRPLPKTKSFAPSRCILEGNVKTPCRHARVHESPLFEEIPSYPRKSSGNSNRKRLFASVLVHFSRSKKFFCAEKVEK